jgi:sigma-B regulation protein RsbU (phosphoserine phosphatase)
MSLRTKLIMLVSGLGAAVIALTLLLVNGRLTSYFTGAAKDDLRNARDTLKQSLAESLEVYKIEGRIIADVTMLKEALIRQSPELAYTYADSARDTASTSYLLILDATGRVLADAKNELVPGTMLSFATAGEPWNVLAGFVAIEGQLVAVAVVPVTMDDELIGYLLLGDPIARTRLGTVQRAARSDITLLDLEGRSIVSTLSNEGALDVVAKWRDSSPSVASIRAVTLAGNPHLLTTEPLIGMGGEVLGSIVVTRSLVDQLRTTRSLQRWLVVLGVAITLLAVVLGALIAYQIVAPLRKLTDAAQRLAKGESVQAGDPRAEALPSASNDEIGNLAHAFTVMAAAVTFRQERLEKEMQLAQTIQSAILPQRFEIAGLDLSAGMVPATEVGGDYYDVLPAPDGCWIGIGDVAGHGLNAGLTMLMLQSMVTALTKHHQDASPREIVNSLNDALFDNVHGRLQKDDHATFTLLRYRRDGRLVFAGAHEEILIYRAASSRVECIPTVGAWVGARPAIHDFTRDTTIELHPQDVLVLYSDGVTQARDSSGEMFGLERLTSELARVQCEPAGKIREHLQDRVLRWAHEPDDDVTLLVAKYIGV